MKEMFGGNVTQIAEMAEKFYQSIGFPKLPASFYERSKFQESDYPGGLPVSESQKIKVFELPFQHKFINEKFLSLACSFILWKQEIVSLWHIFCQNELF